MGIINKNKNIGGNKMQVIKRNGEIQEFNFEKIKNALDKAFKSTGRTGAPSILFEHLEH